MKRTFIYSIVILLATALFFTSCKPSRVWANKKKEKKEYAEPEKYDRRYETPPPPRPVSYASYTSLIITPYPGFVMKQNPDGKFYHRTAQGYLYWKGYDNRFYLDSYYLGKVRYSSREYDEWNRYRRNSR